MKKQKEIELIEVLSISKSPQLTSTFNELHLMSAILQNHNSAFLNLHK